MTTSFDNRADERLLEIYRRHFERMWQVRHIEEVRGSILDNIRGQRVVRARMAR